MPFVTSVLIAFNQDFPIADHQKSGRGIACQIPVEAVDA